MTQGWKKGSREYIQGMKIRDYDFKLSGRKRDEEGEEQ